MGHSVGGGWTKCPPWFESTNIFNFINRNLGGLMLRLLSFCFLFLFLVCMNLVLRFWVFPGPGVSVSDPYRYSYFTDPTSTLEWTLPWYWYVYICYQNSSIKLFNVFLFCFCLIFTSIKLSYTKNFLLSLWKKKKRIFSKGFWCLFYTHWSGSVFTIWIRIRMQQLFEYGSGSETRLPILSLFVPIGLRVTAAGLMEPSGENKGGPSEVRTYSVNTILYLKVPSHEFGGVHAWCCWTGLWKHCCSVGSSIF